MSDERRSFRRPVFERKSQIFQQEQYLPRAMPQPEPISRARFPVYELPPEYAFIMVEKDMRFIPMCLVDDCLTNGIMIGEERIAGNLLYTSGLLLSTAEERLVEHLRRHNIDLPTGIDFAPFGRILEQPPIKEYPFRTKKHSRVKFY